MNVTRVNVARYDSQLTAYGVAAKCSRSAAPVKLVCSSIGLDVLVAAVG